MSRARDLLQQIEEQNTDLLTACKTALSYLVSAEGVSSGDAKHYVDKARSALQDALKEPMRPPREERGR